MEKTTQEEAARLLKPKYDIMDAMESMTRKERIEVVLDYELQVAQGKTKRKNNND